MSAPLTAEVATVLEMADGLDMAAEAEVLVIDGLAKYADMFLADDRDPKTMRALRVYNEAKSNHRRFVNEAHALRALTTQLAERDADLRDADAQDEHYKVMIERLSARISTLTEALTLARNRLQMCALDHPMNSRPCFERSEWADEATAARPASPDTRVVTTELLTEAQDLAFTAIKRMRAGHVNCNDLTTQAEAYVGKIRAIIDGGQDRG